MRNSELYPSQDSLFNGFESRYNSISEEPYEESRENMRICVVGEARNNKELVNILVNHYNFHVVYSEKGIEYRNNDEVIFVINDFESPDFKYLNSCSKLILGPAIIRSCMLNNSFLPTVRKNRPIYCNSMLGMRFSLSGCSMQESRRAVDLIHFMNGSARKNYTPADTLIAKSAMGEKYRMAINLAQVVYTLDWIEECWRHRDDINFKATDPKLQAKYRIKCFQCLRIYFVGFADDNDFEELKQTTKKHGGSVVSKYENCTHAVCAYDLSARPFTNTYILDELPRELNPSVKHVSREWFWKSVHMEQCASEQLYSANGIPSRPFQSKENMPSRKRIVGDSPSPDDALRPNRKNNSKASLENLENSNNSSALPEHMYSSDNLDNISSPKKNDKRFQICVEMLETEENYIRMLHMLITLYKKPLELLIINNEELLNKKEIAIIFSKIAPIIDVHTNIRNNLNVVIQNWKTDCLVGKIWADGSADLMKVYPPYVNSYDESIKTVEFCDQTRPKFHTFLKMAESNPECQKNSLKDMLIRPIQRIPSVLLLLQELFKKTDKSNSDYKWVKHAVDYLKNVLVETNESRRKTENFQRFIELCYDIEDLPVDIMTSAREFVQSIDVVVLDAGGALQKLKSKTISMFLFNDIVVLTKCRFNSSTLMNSTVGSFGGSGTIKSRTSTLGRQISFTNFKRHKERKPYKYIYHRFFSAFRTMELVRSHGVFVVKLRDEKADELCFFQLTNGTTVEAGIEFFKNLIEKLMKNSSREISLEELTIEQLQSQCNSRPEEYEAIIKALSTASELTSTGVIRRPSQLRRAVSNVSLGISSGLHRFTSRSRLSNIGELK